jgi:hypothetical protein
MTVQHQEPVLVLQYRRERDSQRLAGLFLNLQRLRDRSGHHRRVAQGCKLDEGHAVFIVELHLRGDCQRQAGFANAGCPAQGEGTGIARPQAVADRLQVVLAADQGCGR